MNTTHTKEPTDQKEKQKVPQLLSEIGLRDYFAAKAMTGFNREMVAYEWGEDVMDKAARNAYGLADAMIKARGN